MKGSLSLARLKRAMTFITENLADDIGLEQIAGELQLSESHFAHEFRQLTGVTPYQYLLQRRLEKAKRLLKTTQLPIQTISALTGFRHTANFVRMFRQRVGLTPGAWRRDGLEVNFSVSERSNSK